MLNLKLLAWIPSIALILSNLNHNSASVPVGEKSYYERMEEPLAGPLLALDENYDDKGESQFDNNAMLDGGSYRNLGAADNYSPYNRMSEHGSPYKSQQRVLFENMEGKEGSRASENRQIWKRGSSAPAKLGKAKNLGHERKLRKTGVKYGSPGARAKILNKAVPYEYKVGDYTLLGNPYQSGDGGSKSEIRRSLGRQKRVNRNFDDMSDDDYVFKKRSDGWNIYY